MALLALHVAHLPTQHAGVSPCFERFQKNVESLLSLFLEQQLSCEWHSESRVSRITLKRLTVGPEIIWVANDAKIAIKIIVKNRVIRLPPQHRLIGGNRLLGPIGTSQRTGQVEQHIGRVGRYFMGSPKRVHGLIRVSHGLQGDPKAIQGRGVVLVLCEHLLKKPYGSLLITQLLQRLPETNSRIDMLGAKFKSGGELISGRVCPLGVHKELTVVNERRQVIGVRT